MRVSSGGTSSLRYLESHWNLVLMSVLRMMYLWLCLEMNCEGIYSHLLLQTCMFNS
jgi:hypothetical protein